MQTAQTQELFWLTLTILMTALMWVPYIINRLLEQGVLPALLDAQGRTATDRAWAGRMMKAHENAVENLAVFAPLVLMVQWSGSNSAATAMACKVYFLARLAHFLVFTFGVPVLRVISFLAGFSMQLVLAHALLA